MPLGNDKKAELVADGWRQTTDVEKELGVGRGWIGRAMLRQDVRPTRMFGRWWVAVADLPLLEVEAGTTCSLAFRKGAPPPLIKDNVPCPEVGIDLSLRQEQRK